MKWNSNHSLKKNTYQGSEASCKELAIKLPSIWLSHLGEGPQSSVKLLLTSCLELKRDPQ